MSSYFNIEARIIQSDVIVYHTTFYNKESEVTFTACTSFLYSYVSLSTTFGRLNNVTYTIQFITGYTVPSDGAFSILFDDDYIGNFFTMDLNCTLISGFGPSSVCRVGNKHRIDIILNDYSMDS